MSTVLERFAIDDGRHLPKIVIDEDASTAAGTARFRSTCSCGRMPQLPAGTRDQALASHIAHVNTRLGPSRGPTWMPLGPRVAILAITMLLTWLGCYAAGHLVVDELDFGTTATMAVLGGFHFVGLALAFSLMVAFRRYIAPTRA